MSGVKWVKSLYLQKSNESSTDGAPHGSIGCKIVSSESYFLTTTSHNIMAFSFGFTNDVGSDDDMDVAPVSAAPTRSPVVSQVPVRDHKLDDLVGKKNHQTSYQGCRTAFPELVPAKAASSEMGPLRSIRLFRDTFLAFDLCQEDSSILMVTR